MKDFFYYSMIRSKDENTTKTRKLDGTVPLEELPNLMRAMGHYPTEQEIQNMIDEVRYSNFTETGQKVTSFDLDTFVRLFVNHRPVYAVGMPHIEQAFGALLGGDKKGSIPRDNLMLKLQREGEPIAVQDVSDYLFSLVGERDFKALPGDIDAEAFSKMVLGFEEVEEEDSEEDEGEEEGKHVAFDLPAEETND